MAQKDKTKEELIEEIDSLKKRIAEFESADDERKPQTDVVLRKSEAELRAILDATPFPVAIVDIQDDKISYWSHSAEVIFGHTATTAAGWYELAYPDMDYRNQVIAQWRPALEKARLTGQPVNAGEYQVTCRDGSVRICELYATFLTDKLVVTFNDITERKKIESEKEMMLEALRRNEAQLSNALKIASLGPWEYDLINNVFIFNDAFYAVFRTTAEQVGGYLMSPDDYAKRFVHPEDAGLVAIETRKAIETDDPFFSRQLEHRVIFADGEIGYITVRFFIVKDKNGKTIKTYGVNQDISERKKMEAEIQKRLQELEVFYKVSIGREERIIELKKEVESLKKELGA